MQVASESGGEVVQRPAMPLVSRWKDGEGRRGGARAVLALGRIGSPDAVQDSSGRSRLVGSSDEKPSELRVAAVEALRLAATPAALGTLEGLSDDGDRAVAKLRPAGA